MKTDTAAKIKINIIFRLILDIHKNKLFMLKRYKGVVRLWFYSSKNSNEEKKYLAMLVERLHSLSCCYRVYYYYYYCYYYYFWSYLYN